MDRREQAKRLILQLVSQSQPDGFEGKTRLYKAFYYAHLYYFDMTGRPLTSWEVVHMPYGPGVDEGDHLLFELRTEGRLRIVQARTGPYPTVRFEVGDRASSDDLSPRSAEVARAVMLAASYALGRTAAELTAETHDYSRAWQLTRDGEDLDIALDSMDEDEYLATKQTAEAARRELSAVLGDNAAR